MPGLSQARFCAEARNYAAKKRPDLQDGRATSAAIGLEGRGQEARSRKSDARSQELKANSYFPSRASKRKASAFPKRILAKSWYPGLSRKLLSPGTRTPGTRSTAELPPQTHSSPIDRTCAAGVSDLRFLRRSEGLRTLINDWSKSAASKHVVLEQVRRIEMHQHLQRCQRLRLRGVDGCRSRIVPAAAELPRALAAECIPGVFPLGNAPGGHAHEKIPCSSRPIRFSTSRAPGSVRA